MQRSWPAWHRSSPHTVVARGEGARASSPLCSCGSSTFSPTTSYCCNTRINEWSRESMGNDVIQARYRSPPQRFAIVWETFAIMSWAKSPQICGTQSRSVDNTGKKQRSFHQRPPVQSKAPYHTEFIPFNAGMTTVPVSGMTTARSSRHACIHKKETSTHIAAMKRAKPAPHVDVRYHTYNTQANP